MSDNKFQGLLAGKTGVIFGVAHKTSIAWGIAKKLHDAGMKLAFTYHGERLLDNVKKVARWQLHKALSVTRCAMFLFELWLQGTDPRSGGAPSREPGGQSPGRGVAMPLAAALVGRQVWRHPKRNDCSMTTAMLDQCNDRASTHIACPLRPARLECHWWNIPP